MQYITIIFRTRRSVIPADAIISPIAGLFPWYGKFQLSGVKLPKVPMSKVANGHLENMLAAEFSGLLLIPVIKAVAADVVG